MPTPPVIQFAPNLIILLCSGIGVIVVAVIRYFLGREEKRAAAAHAGEIIAELRAARKEVTQLSAAMFDARVLGARRDEQHHQIIEQMKEQHHRISEIDRRVSRTSDGFVNLQTTLSDISKSLRALDYRCRRKRPPSDESYRG